MRNMKLGKSSGFVRSFREVSETAQLRAETTRRYLHGTAGSNAVTRYALRGCSKLQRCLKISHVVLD